MIDPRVIPWEKIYQAGSLQAAADLVMSTPRTRREVLAGVRGFAERFGVDPGVPASHEPEVEAVLPPRRSVILLGATATDGCIGHVSAYLPRGRRMGGGISEEGQQQIPGAAEVLDAILRTIAPLAPEAPRPILEHVMPIPAAGDSHALAAGLVSVLAILGAEAAPAIAATGGWDDTAGRFQPVPAETLSSKLTAAARWGVKKVLVIEGQEGLEDSPVEIVQISSDPGALPLMAVEHAASDVGAAGVRRALGLFDMQVARRHSTSLESIFKATERFVDPEICRDPVLRQIAADIRSRTCLHRGRSVEAGEWLEVALELRGRSFLPDGLIGDYLLYQQAAHHSVTLIDHGILEDPPNGPPVHANVTKLIEELSGRWCTRHQSLCRIFLRNTRARRLEYLARFRLEPTFIDKAVEDMFAEREHWGSLIEDYAQHSLRMGDTNVRRVHNQLIDLAVTEASLTDPRAYGTRDWTPPSTPLVDRLADFLWTTEVEKVPDDGSLYDLVGLLKWWWLRGEGSPVRIAGALQTLGEATGFPASLAAEFLMRLGADDASNTLRHSISGATQSGSILSILALRSACILGSSLEEIVPPVEGTPLRLFFDSLRDDEEYLVARCPY